MVPDIGMTRGDPRVGVGEGVTYSGVYASLILPGLVIGTVGGGTQLATQKECLSMMGCYGKVRWQEWQRLSICSSEMCCIQ